jgi:hypothetical protein
VRQLMSGESFDGSILSAAIVAVMAAEAVPVGDLVMVQVGARGERLDVRICKNVGRTARKPAASS